MMFRSLRTIAEELRGIHRELTTLRLCYTRWAEDDRARWEEVRERDRQMLEAARGK